MLKVANITAGITSLLTALSLLLIDPAHAQSQFDRNGAASLTSRLGIATTKLWLDDRGIDIPPSTLPPEQQHAEIENALKRYETLRDNFAGVSTAGSAMKIGAAGVTGGLALLSGPAAPATVLIGAGAVIGLDAANDKIEQIGKEQATNMLASMADDLIATAGVKDFSALVGQPDLLRDTIINSPSSPAGCEGSRSGVWRPGFRQYGRRHASANCP